MIQTMRQLALDFIYHKLNGQGDAETWYRDVRQNDMGKLFPYLVEAARDSLADNYYVLYPDPNDARVAVLEQRVRKKEDELKLPFVQSTGSQSPALGPVIKRSYAKTKGGPSEKILDSTLAFFGEIGMQGMAWSEFFSYAQALLSRSILHSRIDGKVYEGKPAFHLAVEQIPETRTAYLSILDKDGKLPGERGDYRAYLEGVLASEKYSTGSIQPVEQQRDALTGELTMVYPNSLTGAGLNLTNVDRVGVFADLNDSNAWKKFSLGAANADLLYTFSFHMRDDFVGRVAGELALVLPHLALEQRRRQRFIRDFKIYVSNLKQTKRDSDTSAQEKRLLHYFKNQQDAVATITILWASFGQKLENVTGMVTDVLPSRLSVISDAAQTVTQLQSPVFPPTRLKMPSRTWPLTA